MNGTARLKGFGSIAVEAGQGDSTRGAVRRRFALVESLTETVLSKPERRSVHVVEVMHAV